MPVRPWTVTPHGPIEKLDDGIWSLESPIPGIPGRGFLRRMTIVRRADGTLMFFNAVPMDDPTLAQLKALGPFSALVVPAPTHAMDAPAFRDKLGVRVYAPADSLGALRSRDVPIDAPLEELPPDARVRTIKLDGLSTGEHVVTITDGSRVTVLLCDQVLNVPHGPGFWGLAWRLMGLTGGPRIGPFWRKKFVADEAVYRRSFEALADLPGLARVVPSHGPVIDRDPGQVLRTVVKKLKR